MDALAEPTLPLFEPVEKETAPNQHRSRWTPENDAELKRMFKDGMSYGAIASVMHGFSRNAVIGRAHRLGLGGRMEARPTWERKVPSLRRPTRRKGALKKLRGFDCEEIIDLPPEVSEFAVGFLEAKENHCRYPIGDPRNLNEFKFCGGAVSKGLSYCARHCRVVFEPLKPGDRDGRSERPQFECATSVDHRASRKTGGTAFRFGGRY